MKYAYKLDLTEAEATYINCCPPCQNVLTIADMKDENGTMIVIEAYTRPDAQTLSKKPEARCI
jgi:hypothetical protein